jgi:oxalate---CoA ligase
LQQTCRQNSAAVALLAPGCAPLTYGQWGAQVDYVGLALRSFGVPRAGRVAVVLPNGPTMAAAFWGVAAYATCAPLNPFYRPAEFEFYLSDLEAQVVIVPAEVDSPVREVTHRLGLKVLELEPAINQLAGSFQFRHVPPITKTPSDWGECGDTALMLHTSGTTSRPKLVPLSHQNLCASARNIVNALRLSSEDRCLNVMPLFHIHGLVGVLCASICAGGSVVCCPGYQDDGFAHWLRDFEPTWFSAVPTIHQAVLAAARQQPTIIRAGRLRLIRSSSASLPPTVMRDLEATFDVPVIESYGMTEAAHQMASNPLPPAPRKPGSVGLPAGPEMAIMDDHGALLPAGATGEIVIRGPNVTTGYAVNPPANAAAFTNGWFRTGDRGRTDDDGYFYITGRTKEMINRGGENISPREIDEVLLAHDDVVQAVAFAVPHLSLGEDVAAAVVLRPGSTVTEHALRRFAYARLAPGKVPNRIVMVPEIPKGPTGKVQRIGLHDTLAAALRREHVAPRTVLEAAIADVFADILAVDRVGAVDNFFALGGDSLQAMRVIHRISTIFQIELSAVALFLQPTPEELGVEVTRCLGHASGMLEQMLNEIEQMPEDEVRRAIESKGQV